MYIVMYSIYEGHSESFDIRYEGGILFIRYLFTLLKESSFKHYALLHTPEPFLKDFTPGLIWDVVNKALVLQPGLFCTAETSSTQLFLHMWEQEEVAWCQVRRVGWMADQLDSTVGQKMQCCSCCVRAGIVVVQ